MPQQQENSGCMSQRASLGCRFCFIDSHDREKLDIDMIVTGRFHHDTMRIRKQMSTLDKTRAAIYGREQGLDPAEPRLVSVSPALDLLITRPSDHAHSEFNGITKQMHMLALPPPLP